MHDTRRVSSRQRTGYLNSHIKRFSKLYPRGRHARAQCFAVYELSGNEVDGVCLSDFVDRKDVGMVQTGSSLCFLDEATHALGVRSNLGMENLQSNRAIELGIVGEIDFAHATRTNLGTNLVAAQSCAGGQGHRFPRMARFWVRHRLRGTAPIVTFTAATTLDSTFRRW